MGISIFLRGEGDMKKSEYDSDKNLKIDGAMYKEDYDADDDNKIDPEKLGLTYRQIKATGDVTYATNSNVVDYCDTTYDIIAFKHTFNNEWIKSVKIAVRFYTPGGATHIPFYLTIVKVSNNSEVISKLIGYNDDHNNGDVVEYTTEFSKSEVYVDGEYYIGLKSEESVYQNQVGAMGINSGGSGNAYRHNKNTDSWGQISSADVYGIIKHYKQYSVVRLE